MKSSFTNSQTPIKQLFKHLSTDSLYKLIGALPSQTSPKKNQIILTASYFDTAIGTMIIIADHQQLFLLDFADRPNLAKRIAKLKFQYSSNIISGESEPISLIKKELDLYFKGELTTFTAQFAVVGSDFQKKAWHHLLKVPYGQTISYLEHAKHIKNKKAFRAVANANNANNLVILIPCHRVINNNGKIGGYGGGEERKQYLINLEKTSVMSMSKQPYKLRIGGSK